jgi:hypothetical protein
MGALKLKAGLLLILLLAVSLPLEGMALPPNGKAILIGRCVGNCVADDLTQEFAVEFADAATSGRIAIRLCSSERAEIAIAKASTNLAGMVYNLKRQHNVSLNDVSLLFSRGCRAAGPGRVATEFWAIPRASSLPPHDKSIKISAISISVARQEKDKALMYRLLRNGEGLEETPVGPTATSETDATAQLLRSERGSYAVVIGFYFARPTAELKRRVRRARQQLEKDAALRGRFSTHVIPFGVNYTGSVEPNDPHFYVVTVGP